MVAGEQMKRMYELLRPVLDERTRRLVPAAMALASGHGGIAKAARATGVSRRAVAAGIRELKHPQPLAGKRTRRAGGGRKPLTARDTTVRGDLERLVDPVTRGHPQSPLRWTCKSVRRLSEELRRQGHRICPQKVADLLHDMDYSLQANRKTREGADHPDRNAQFEHINEKVKAFLAAGWPAISVDTKKKELVGPFKNTGRQWRPAGSAEKVKVHDFLIKELGRASPYGIYDIGQNLGWVNVGTDHDTAEFAVESIRRWWYAMGHYLYEDVPQLLIVADGGGSNGARLRLWKVELQQLADEIGLEISVCHLPPGTSKWNKIEHRLFSHITMNWQGQPLVSHEVIINLIAATTSKGGLHVHCRLDTNHYAAGIKVPDQEMAQLNIKRDDFHGDWNYSLLPRPGTT